DTFEMLHERGLLMEQKNFAVGLRIEHEQKTINRSQYGSDEVTGVGAADYKLAHQCANGRNVYTFCMCPGGYVVNASSEPGRLAVNGMSYSGRDSANANSAIIVSVDRSDFGSDHPLAGLTFQRHLEEEAYRLGNGKVPVQRYGDLACGITTTAFGHIRPLTKGDHQMSDLSKLFPEQILQAILEAIPAFGKKIAGFDDEDAILSGVESRTSSPLRILRGDDLMAGIRGVYPCGEGAGYAGGIMSAAMDGMKVAEAIILDYNENFEERNGTDKRKRT
ncbi:MAG: FAD-dependent oxidoreductase, partial [Lachnospiraceae bacterium]|nr:FAD-dependent oxidoreductase [Lachnospiraceae bacterium]